MRWYSSSAVAAVVLLAVCSESMALRVAVPNIRPQQAVLKANAVVVGKVVEIEKDPVEAANGPNQPKMTYTIGVIKIEEAIAGARGLTQVRVGFAGIPKNVPAPAPQPNLNPNIKLIRPIGPIGGVQINLTKDQEGLFFLNKHPSGDFYVLMPFVQPVAKTAEDFKTQVATVKATLKIVEKPIDALKATEAKDREQAALILLQKYTVQQFGLNTPATKQVPIPAEENKLIVGILSEMQWAKNDPETGLGLSTVWYSLNPVQLGWKQPQFQPNQDINKVMSESVHSFLKANKDKFRIQMFVEDNLEK